jgi:alanyl-tRNA synthetase
VTNKRYFDDPLTYQFTAQVQNAVLQEDGTSHIILDQSYFYPTGGGQSHDKGWINGVDIIDVRQEGETVIHVINEQVSGEVECQIDADYRIANMQAHTGQHILSAAFLQTIEAHTLAVKMNAFVPSSVDVNQGDLSVEQIQAVEKLANQVIMENRPVKSYFVSPNDPKLNELRRAVKFDKVSSNVRLVEIGNFDLSACAGTHFPNTGMLGLLKILRADNYKGGSRILFAVGYQALEQFRHYHQSLEDVSNLLSSSTSDVYSLVEKLQNERQDLEKRLKALREQALSYEAAELLKKAENLGDMNLIKVPYEGRTNDELRILGNLLTSDSNNVAVLLNRNDSDLTIVVCASDTSGIHAGNTLKAIVSQFDGRGGGRENYAQGVLKDFADTEALLQTINENLVLA